MGDLYRLRSWVEHLHNPLDRLAGDDRDEKQTHFLLRTLQAEAIARHCLRTFLLSRLLQRQFRDDASRRAFWEKTDAERRALWRAPLDLDAVTASCEGDLSDYYIGM